MSGLVSALFGCGQIGAGYAADPLMARHYPYASHAQVLADHPAFSWRAAIDPAIEHARACADAYHVIAASDVAGLDDPGAIEVAVLATPPGTRRAIVEALPGLQAVIVEKPLGATETEADEFAALCRQRGLTVQVNMPRRADTCHRALANGGLGDAVGDVQAGFVIYGNGLRNNGTHMIDFVRMLLGEVRSAAVPADARVFVEGPIENDLNTPFILTMESGLTVMGQPVGFGHYRENALDLWGTCGRLSLVSEGLRICRCERRPNRSTTGAHEIASDDPDTQTTTIGNALYEIYDDLAQALAHGRVPVSSLDSALITTAIVEDLMRQAGLAKAA